MRRAPSDSFPYRSLNVLTHSYLLQNVSAKDKQGSRVLKSRKTNEVVEKTAEPVRKDVAATKSKATIPPPKARVTKKVAASKTTVVAAKSENDSHKETVAAVIKETRSQIKHVELPADMSVDDLQHTSNKVRTQDWDDLDGPEMGDPSMVSEYVVEIFEYMKELEVSRAYFIWALISF